MGMRSARLRTIGLAMFCVGFASAGSAFSQSRPFTFRDAEFMSPDRGLQAAQQFTIVDLPPGLPIGEARRRVQRAAMFCRPAQGAATVCEYSLPIHVEGGVIGEDRWRVTLIADNSGALGSARVDHYTVGTPNPQ